MDFIYNCIQESEIWLKSLKRCLHVLSRFCGKEEEGGRKYARLGGAEETDLAKAENVPEISKQDDRGKEPEQKIGLIQD